MTTAYPAALDSFTNPTSADTLDSATVPHAAQHANANDAIEAIEAKLGTTSTAATLPAGLVVGKAAGTAIKIDPDSPGFGWRDLLGEIFVRDSTLVTAPHYFAYRTPIRAFQFDLNDEAWLAFHLPHDYAPGTDLHFHVHWSQNETRVSGGSQVATNAVTGGSVSFEVQAIYSKGHGQEAFSAPTNALTITQSASTTKYFHHIAEVQLSATSPAATQIDTDNIEVDGLLLVYIKHSANNLTVSAGSAPDPFVHYCDLHYQSTGLPTKGKAPNFYA